MSEKLEVIESPSKPEYPAELHIRISYNADYGTSSLYEGTEMVAYGCGFVNVKEAGSWEALRTKLIEAAEERAAIIREYGAPPANEVVELRAAG